MIYQNKVQIVRNNLNCRINFLRFDWVVGGGTSVSRHMLLPSVPPTKWQLEYGNSNSLIDNYGGHILKRGCFLRSGIAYFLKETCISYKSFRFTRHKLFYLELSVKIVNIYSWLFNIRMVKLKYSWFIEFSCFYWAYSYTTAHS